MPFQIVIEAKHFCGGYTSPETFMYLQLYTNICPYCLNALLCAHYTRTVVGVNASVICDVMRGEAVVHCFILLSF